MNVNIFVRTFALVLLVVMLPVCFADSLSLTYDKNGNLVTGDGFYRIYNSLNQLWKVYNGSDTSLLLQEYTMHPVEERVLVKNVINERPIVRYAHFAASCGVSINS